MEMKTVSAKEAENVQEVFHREQKCSVILLLEGTDHHLPQRKRKSSSHPMSSSNTSNTS